MFLTIWGKKIFYEIYGAEHDEALLYLHGGPGASCLDFANQAKVLSKKSRVVIFDQLGVLRSDALGENEDYSMEYQIEMIEEMRRLLGIEKWSILGHSYGGALAVLYAYLYPASIHKVILECPSLCFEDSAKSVAEYLSGYIHDLNNKSTIELCEKIKVTDYQNKREVVYDLLTLLDDITDMKLRNYLHAISFEEYLMNMDTSNITDEMWAKGERHLLKLLDDGTAASTTQATPDTVFPKRILMTDDFLPMLKEIILPVLLINGKYDPACSKHQITYLMNNAKNVTQALFENSGHFPRIEEADKYTNTIFHFLEV